jgi:hypothetical protein
MFRLWSLRPICLDRSIIILGSTITCDFSSIPRVEVIGVRITDFHGRFLISKQRFLNRLRMKYSRIDQLARARPWPCECNYCSRVWNLQMVHPGKSTGYIQVRTHSRPLRVQDQSSVKILNSPRDGKPIGPRWKSESRRWTDSMAPGNLFI